MNRMRGGWRRLGLASVLGLVLATQAMAGEIDPMQYLPGEVDMVGRVDLRALLAAPEFAGLKAMSASVKEEAPLMEKIEAAGLVAENLRDLTWVSTIPATPMAKPSGAAVIRAINPFDAAALTKALKEDEDTEVEEATVAGKTVLLNKDEDMAVCVLDTRSLLLGTEAAVRAALGTGAKVGANKALMDRADASARSETIWVAGLVSEAMTQGIPADAPPFLKTLKSYLVTIHNAAAITTVVKAEFRDEQSPQMATGMVTMLAGQYLQPMGLQMQAVPAGNSATITVTLPAEKKEELVQMAMQQAMATVLGGALDGMDDMDDEGDEDDEDEGDEDEGEGE